MLATVLHAVDAGWRVVLADDAICSSSDEGHDAMLNVFHGRFTHQVDTASAEDILAPR